MDDTIIELGLNAYMIPGKGGLGSTELFSSHSYVFLGEKMNVLIDPGSTAHGPAVLEALSGLSRQVDINLLIVTHEHWDHILGADSFPDASKAASEDGINELNDKNPDVVRHEMRGHSYESTFDRALKDGEVIDIGGFQLEILLTPGHTGGSLCVYEPRLKWLFTGDTFFAHGSVSRIFGTGGRAEHLKTLERLSELELEAIFPGHGDVIVGRDACLDNMETSLARVREKLKYGEEAA